ncbi:septation protein SepH, partial [Ornithinicoccus halotolerans]|uniref:septation protein SepH n=1 Tax=Ornithinicoccus halotolerans TaxID=1748220 RepID=UPI0012950335
MRQLRFTAVHEDGQHLVLTDPGDGEECLVEIDERLRDAVRGRRSGIGEHPAQALTPRTVQAMMRAGESAEEVAAATGWPVDRVQRYEAPILAEREHVATLAQRCEVRGRAADGTERPTLESRVRERLTARGVDPDLARWDASRPEGGQWTVLVGFVAGNRERRAAWRFDPAARHVEALDDEARWLSEDEQALPGGAGGYAGLGGDGT